VTRKTQKGLRKLRDDIEENRGKLFARMHRNSNMTQSERVDDGHGRNGQDDEVTTIPSSGLFSDL
jgi:hypothetical protein